MDNSCVVCLMRPFLLFSFTIFTSMSCQHSTHPCEPSEIHVSRKKRYFGYVLQILTAISGCFELYRTFGKMDNFKDIMRVLMYSEFITMLLVLLKIIRLNFFWKEKNEELKVVLYVSECLRRFQVEEECLELYKFHHYSFYGGAIGIVVTCGCQIAQYSGDFNYVELLNRISLVYLVMSFYLWIWIDIAVYTILFKLIFDQLSRVVEFRFYKTYDDWIPKLSIVHEESAFLRQMKDLRRLYMTVLGSLRRSKIIIGGVVESLAVSVCLQLTWLLFVTIMGITGTVELDTKYFAFCVRHIVQWSLLVLLARTCDKIQVLVEGMSAILFRVPSARMDGGEIKEIEIFVKLLGWEQPLKSANDKGPFGRSFLCSLTIDILVNCMVITQLYFWFNK